VNKVLATSLTVLVAALALAACGEKSENVTPQTRSFDVMLDYVPNADHIGIYEALAKGYFKQAGLDVHLHSPADTSSPIKEAAAGRVDLAITYEPEVILGHEQGLDVKSVAALVNRPLTSLISLPKAGIDSPDMLKGKRVANAGLTFQTGFLDAILKANNLTPGDVKQVDVQEGLLPAIISHKADAIFGGYPNVEGVSLQKRKLNPKIVPADQLGVPTYDELVLVASGDELKRDSEPVRLFLAALARGTNDAVKDPSAGISELRSQEGVLDAKLLQPEVKATLPYLQPAAGKPFGYMDSRHWQTFIGWMRDNGLSSELPAPAELLTSDLLPGRIPT
jgi:putative hydroxymethylpyrimidine transport system substrate-binding protein